VRYLRDVSIEKLLGEVFSVRSVPRCYKQDRFRVWLVVRQSPASTDVNTEIEKATTLEAVTRQQPVTINQTVRAIVNCRLCEFALVL
jgi:hypothetical protein